MPSLAYEWLRHWRGVSGLPSSATHYPLLHHHRISPHFDCRLSYRIPLLVNVRFFRFNFVHLTALAAIYPILALAELPKANHLAHEKSPYLQQHAFNPVDWYPWGTEAFEKARRENKPIFLSVGYSTCHWCHVMERESFTDPATAQILNENFVCIKVDREERPDVDRVYLNFVETLTGGGGWPMSVWLTPELKPFFGGTYFAPEDASGRPGFKTLLRKIAHEWGDESGHATYEKQAGEMMASLTRTAGLAGKTEAAPVEELRDRAFKALRDTFDKENGGFERAPKFPLPVRLEFLFDLAATATDPARRDSAKRMALTTLRKMADGGIHDQLGGGFHRYSVDARWRVPHFEKMLYDQAQLASAYLTAWQISREASFKETAGDILRYVQENMTDQQGGFYSAEDADSAGGKSRRPNVEGRRLSESDRPPAAEVSEGAFYLWAAEEIEKALGSQEVGIFRYAYGIEASGNMTAAAKGEFAGQNVLYLAHSVAECAGKFGLSEAQAQGELNSARNTLGALRAKRPRPQRDEKIITAWNGLMISAFARAGQIFDEVEYTRAAERAAAFIQANLFDKDSGRLVRSYRGGIKDAQGFAEDYAFLIQGLLDLYETDFDVRWLAWAITLQEKQIELFNDANGGFFANTADDKSVLLRLKENYDNAEPSPNSIAVKNLARLAGLLHRDDWLILAQRTADAFTTQLKRDPLAMPQMLASGGWLMGSSMQIIIQGEAGAESTKKLIAEVRRKFLPRKTISLIDSRSRAFFESRVPFVVELPATQETATAYVCENFVCQLPTSDPAVLARLLDRPRSFPKP